MTTQATDTNKVINDIIQTAIQVCEIDRIEDNSDNEIYLYYHNLGQGSIISQRINELMTDKYFRQDYRIKMIPSEQYLIITLL